MFYKIPSRLILNLKRVYCMATWMISCTQTDDMKVFLVTADSLGWLTHWSLTLRCSTLGSWRLMSPPPTVFVRPLSTRFTHPLIVRRARPASEYTGSICPLQLQYGDNLSHPPPALLTDTNFWHIWQNKLIMGLLTLLK